MTGVFAKVLPIILLMTLGFIMRQKKLIREGAINELKQTVINIFLPALLFVTFIDMQLQKEYIYVFIASFVLLLLFYAVGSLINQIPILKHDMLPFIVTATTFGLLGLPLYETVFGSDNLVKLSILGVGHEIFIWFIYITLMKIKLNKEKISVGIIKDFIKSPLIIAVLTGILLNMMGLSKLFHDHFILNGLYNTLKYLATISTPMILIIVGYGLVLDPKYTHQSLKFVAIRLATMLIVGYIFKYLVLDRFITGDKYFDYAYLTFLILPPPMSLPIFAEKYGNKEYGELTNNTVVLSTIICIMMFIIFAFAVG